MRSASPLDSKKLSVRPQTSPHGRMGDLGGKRGKSSPGTVAGIRKNGVIEPIVSSTVPSSMDATATWRLANSVSNIRALSMKARIRWASSSRRTSLAGI